MSVDPSAYFVDADIFMYAAGARHPLQRPCRDALTRATDREAVLVTDAEVLQELLHRYVSIGRPETARTVHDAAVRLCDDVIAIGSSHTARALEILLEHPGTGARDALHVATMESAGLTRILSTDGDFDTLPQVRRIDPREFLRDAGGGA